MVYAASEPRAGMVVSQGRFFEQGFLNHRVQVEAGVLAEESGELLREFFRARR
jgi:tRNA(Arg) A34 adenosine deaminase TadA